MYFAITNKNFVSAYPNVDKVVEYVNYFDKQTGEDYSAVNINTLEDLMTLDALARSTNNYYIGLRIDGNRITLMEQGYYNKHEVQEWKQKWKTMFVNVVVIHL